MGKVTEIKSQHSDEAVESALATVPESMHEALKQWRVLKDHEDQLMTTIIAPIKERRLELEAEITGQLTIPEGDEKSETFKIDGVGSVSKAKKVSVQVHDWDAFARYCNRNDFGAVLRKQANLAPLQEMYDLIMQGKLPMPQSAEFKIFEKPSFRRN